MNTAVETVFERLSVKALLLSALCIGMVSCSKLSGDEIEVKSEIVEISPASVTVAVDVNDVSDADTYQVTVIVSEAKQQGSGVMPFSSTVDSQPGVTRYTIKVNGLHPDTEYTAMARVTYNRGSSSGKSMPFTTKKLEMVYSSSMIVDLGLSVKWGTCNLGASRPEETGLYFSFGDIEGRTSPDGYVRDHSYELDSENNLKPEYDAAHVLLKSNWRIPTETMFLELLDNCSPIWTDNYNNSGVPGVIILSDKPGYDGHHIFLPEGYSSGVYRSSTASSGQYTLGFYFSPEIRYLSELWANELAPIRPVFSGNAKAVSDVRLDKQAMDIHVGQSDQLSATVLPEDAVDVSVSWKSSDSSVAEVDETGKVTGIGEGTAIISVTTNDGAKTASCAVSVNYFNPPAVDLGLSVKWSSVNLGAFKPEEYGCFFVWADVTGELETSPSFNVDSDNNLMPENDAAHVILGGKWRMPTKEEMTELLENCTASWTNNYNGTGLPGRILTSRKEGFSDSSIFMPAYETTFNIGNFYWTSSYLHTDFAWAVYLDQIEMYMIGMNRDFCYPIRPVLAE